MTSPLTLNKYLSAYRGETIYYAPNPGNAGDSVIALATYQLFARLGLNYVIINPKDPRPETLRQKIIFYGGGGNLVNYYTTAANFIDSVHAGAKKLVILPHTINNHTDLLASLGGNVDVLCREQVSFDYARQAAPGAACLLVEDVALELESANALRPANGPGNPFEFPWPRLLRLTLRLRWHYGVNLTRGQARRPLNSFRLDKGRTAIPIPSDNVDVSGLLSLGWHGVKTEQAAARISYFLLQALNRFEEINTNRLHVCISAAHLGKQVNFYPNNYYKNEAVYRHSLARRFANVRWMG